MFVVFFIKLISSVFRVIKGEQINDLLRKHNRSVMGNRLVFIGSVYDERWQICIG